MKRLASGILSCLGVAVLASLTPLSAGGYFGASAGQASTDLGLNDVSDGSAITGSVDDGDTRWSVYGGWKVLRFFGVEAAWTDLGEISIDGMSDGSGLVLAPGAVHAVADSEGWSVSTLGILPVGDRWELFGKLSYLFWDSDQRISNTGFLGGSTTNSRDGEDLLYGAGTIYDYRGFGALRVEYERGKMGELDVETVSAGLTFLFD